MRGQEIAESHRRSLASAKAATDNHAEANFTRFILHSVQADDRGHTDAVPSQDSETAILNLRGRYANSGAAWTIRIDFAPRARVEQTHRQRHRHTHRWWCCDAVARGLNRAYQLQPPAENRRHGFERRPVELQVLAGGEMRVIAVIGAGDMRHSVTGRLENMP